MSPIYSGAVLREHADKEYRDIGKVVHVSADEREFWWIPLPEIDRPKSDAIEPPEESKDLGGRLRHYIKKPRPGIVAKALEQKAAGTISIIAFKPPHIWSLNDSELKKVRSSDGLLRRSRRNLPRWLEVRDATWEIIKPIVSFATENDTTLGHMLADGSLYEKAWERAVGLNMQSSLVVEQALFRYMLGDCEKNALLPHWGNCGIPGSTKFCSSKPGRPNVEAAKEKDNKALRGFHCSAADRQKLHAGWVRYKKKGVSVYRAYLSTIEEYYAKSVTYVGPGTKIVDPLSPNERPTEAEFRDHGPRGCPELSAARINLGEIEYQQNERPLKGRARDHIVAVGQVGWLDSTPEDQNLVSSASRLKMLPTSHRTMVVEARSEYILGIHAGFEKSSTMTGLMALLHAASSKVDWCARYNEDIKEDDWLQFMPRRVRGDNGDVKSDEGIATLLASEVSLEVVRAWWASHKGPVESKHKVLHRNADHLSAGTSHGRQRTRAEARPDESSCLTFCEKMPTLIRAILKHNNEDLVPHLLTMEMRRDPSSPDLKLKPTRKAIFLWLVENGYVVSEPPNLDLLRAKCLPRFKASIDGGSVRVFDPRYPETRLIPELQYWSQWLHDSGLTTRGRKKVIDCEIHLDPTYPSEAWLNVEGMHRLELRTADPLMKEVTLCDWLAITDDDSLVKFLHRGDKHKSDATHFASARTANEEAQAAKDAELAAAAELPTKKSRRENKRKNHLEEIEHQKRLRSGTAGLGTPPVQYATAAASDDEYVDPDDNPLMQLVRKRTAA